MEIESVIRGRCQSVFSVFSLMFLLLTTIRSSLLSQRNLWSSLLQILLHATPAELQSSVLVSSSGWPCQRRKMEHGWGTARSYTFFHSTTTTQVVARGCFYLPAPTSKSPWWKVVCWLFASTSPLPPSSPSFREGADLLRRYESSALHCRSYVKGCHAQKTKLEADAVGGHCPHLQEEKTMRWFWKNNLTFLSPSQLWVVSFVSEMYTLLKDVKSHITLGQSKDKTERS